MYLCEYAAAGREGLVGRAKTCWLLLARARRRRIRRLSHAEGARRAFRAATGDQPEKRMKKVGFILCLVGMASGAQAQQVFEGFISINGDYYQTDFDAGLQRPDFAGPGRPMVGGSERQPVGRHHGRFWPGDVRAGRAMDGSRHRSRHRRRPGPWLRGLHRDGGRGARARHAVHSRSRRAGTDALPSFPFSPFVARPVGHFELSGREGAPCAFPCVPVQCSETAGADGSVQGLVP